MVTNQNATIARTINDARAGASSPSYQAYRILHLAFIVAPIVAGLDKFFHLLVNWDQYLPPIVNNFVGGHGHELMLGVGVIEVVAGGRGGPYTQGVSFFSGRWRRLVFFYHIMFSHVFSCCFVGAAC